MICDFIGFENFRKRAAGVFKQFNSRDRVFENLPETAFMYGRKLKRRKNHDLRFLKIKYLDMCERGLSPTEECKLVFKVLHKIIIISTIA